VGIEPTSTLNLKQIKYITDLVISSINKLITEMMVYFFRKIE